MFPIPRGALPCAAALAVLCGSAGCQAAGSQAQAAGYDVPSVTPSAAQSGSPSPTPTRTVDYDDALRDALAGLPDGDGRYAVTVEDLGTGEDAAYGRGTFDTASIVKTDILAALLLQAQDDGTSLTAEQQRLARAMICSSDNSATDALWRAIGRGDGLAAANERLGLTDTTPGTGGLWGLTQTTAADQLRLLEAVFGEDSPLDGDSRSYLRALMGDVVDAQRWGVTAAADDPDEAALKNGWLPRTATGLWDVNSIGRVEHDGHTLLVAVLSSGHATEQAGIDLVERVATAAAEAMTTGTTN
ncbi:serine hydrolase [Streptomyces sp. NPDC051940]|uniref:serine hydrolase n=1 Tax=Streptomyces sp. NPDC051940 TaxID=3155675 RepID=UPI003421FF4B